MTTQQGAPLINLGVDITPEVIEKNKWYAFWDAPFVIPGVAQSSPHVGAARARRVRADRGAGSRDRHRRASRRRDEERCLPDLTGACTACRANPRKSGSADATFKTTSCSVKTDGAQGRGRTSPDCRWESSPGACASRPTADRICSGWKRSRRPTSSRSRTSTKGD